MPDYLRCENTPALETPRLLMRPLYRRTRLTLPNGLAWTRFIPTGAARLPAARRTPPPFSLTRAPM